jgi:hypothetical protein
MILNRNKSLVILSSVSFLAIIFGSVFSVYFVRSVQGTTLINGMATQSPFVSLSIVPSILRVGGNVTISGSLTDQTGKPLLQSLTVQVSSDGVKWSIIKTVQPDSTGCYLLSWKPTSCGLFWIGIISGNTLEMSQLVVANSIVTDVTGLRSAIKLGGVVYAQSGQYYLSSSIVVSSNLLLLGAGEKTIFKASTRTCSPMIYGNAVTNVRIVNLAFDGLSLPASLSGGAALYFVNSANIRLESLTIANLDKEGIVLNSCKNATLLNISIRTVWTGIVIRSSSIILVQDSNITWTAGDGIYVTASQQQSGSANVTLNRNLLNTIGDTGIDISNPYGAQSNQIGILNNRYTNHNDKSPSSQKNGIGITLSHCSSVLVLGNVVTSAIGGMLDGIKVQNATVRGNLFSNFTKYGIWVVTPLKINSNSFTMGNASGIMINSCSGNFEISSNTFVNVPVGIKWIGPAPKIAIINNTITNSLLYGVCDGGSNFWTGGSSLISNTIVDTRTKPLMLYGIYKATPGLTWTISNNYIAGAVIAAVRMVG